MFRIMFLNSDRDLHVFECDRWEDGYAARDLVNNMGGIVLGYTYLMGGK